MTFKDRVWDFIDARLWVQLIIFAVVITVALILFFAVTIIAFPMYYLGRVGRSMLEWVGIRMR